MVNTRKAEVKRTLAINLSVRGDEEINLVLLAKAKAGSGNFTKYILALIAKDMQKGIA